MYNRLYNFLEKKIIFSLQFNFRKKYSTTLVLIYQNKIKTDKGNYACGIFIDFQMAFDTVDHHIVLKNLD